jgi:hypothetical protein
MRKAFIAPALCALIVVSLTIAATAEAGYFLNKREAQRLTRQDARDRYEAYGLGRVFAACRPQGLSKPDPRYDYHSWTCGWASRSEGDICGGQLLIKGSRDRDMYWSKVVTGVRCDL